MSEVDTNSITLQCAPLDGSDALPAQPVWRRREPDDITAFGDTITSVSRNPISEDRFEKEPIVTDLESPIEFTEDFTLGLFSFDAPFFCLSNAVGAAVFEYQSGVAGSLVAITDAFTVPSGGALPENTLVVSRGWSNSANNGTFVVGSGATATNIPVAGIVSESGSEGARVEVAGIRGAAGDFEIDADGNLISTLFDFTTLPLVVGQFIHIGGIASGNQFASAANTGVARVVSISTNEIELADTRLAFVADDGSGQEIDILFGQFVRPVSVGSADYNRRGLEFEMSYPGIDGGTDNFEYQTKAFLNTLTWEIPLADKCTVQMGYVATSSDPITPTRKQNAATPVISQQSEGLSSGEDIARLRFDNYDESGFGSCFQSLSVTIDNRMSPRKCIGSLGPVSVNIGNLRVALSGEMAFSDPSLIANIKNNITGSFDFSARNADGGVVTHLPAMKVTGGARQFPKDEKVNVQFEIIAFNDDAFGYPVSFSFFPIYPAPST